MRGADTLDGPGISTLTDSSGSDRLPPIGRFTAADDHDDWEKEAWALYDQAQLPRGLGNQAIDRAIGPVRFDPIQPFRRDTPTMG